MKARRYTLAQKDTQSPVMLEPSSRDEFVIAALPAVPAWRPALFFLSVGLTIAGLVWTAAIALSPGGLGLLDVVLLALFVVTLPWYVIGFWNATIGLLIMRFARDPVAAVTPVAGRVRGDEPITASTAILLCIRNEPPERVARLLQPMMEVLAARGVMWILGSVALFLTFRLGRMWAGARTGCERVGGAAPPQPSAMAATSMRTEIFTRAT